MYRHTVVSGASGYGKSTVFKNWMYQFAHNGDGFLFIDSKATESLDILRMLPEDRMDDVTFLGTGFDGEIHGLNVLETKTNPSDEQFEREVGEIVSAYIRLIRDEEYWGAKMDTFTITLLRALLYANAESDAGYTLADFARAVNDETYRAELTEELSDSVDNDSVQLE